MATPSVRGRRGPGIALAATTLTAFVVLVALVLAIPTPRILSDELTYTVAGASLANGEGLHRRGGEYGFGPLYPTILAAILALVPDRESAYPLFKVANALLFSLTSVPVYLLARRRLPPWWSVGVAAFAVVTPSSVYTSLVMTESVSYLVASTALLAIVLALERATVARQFLALGTIGLATLARPQFALFAVIYLAALGLTWAIVPEGRERRWRGLWPTFGAVALSLVAFLVRPLATGASHADVLGSYSVLWQRYDVLEVAKWLVFHLAALEVYLAVIPLAVAPIVLAQLVREGRAGSTRSAGFLALFVTTNATLLVVAAAFSSTEAGLDRLHGRYLFYVVPMWLVVLAVWLHDGLPRPAFALTVGVVAALVLPASIPFARLIAEDGAEVDSLVTHLWSAIHDAARSISPDELSGRRVLALFVVALLMAVILVPRRYGLSLAGAVATVFLVSSGLTWSDAAGAADDTRVILGAERAWVEQAVPDGRAVTSLYVPRCGGSQRAVTGLLLTEFFNPSVARAAHVETPDGSLLPSVETRVDSGGAVRLESGAPLEAEYLVTHAGVEVDGELVSTGTTVPLVLWRVDGAVEIVGGDRVRAIQAARC